MSTPAPNIFAFLGRGRFSPATPPLQTQLPDLSWTGHLLLPIVIFGIAFLTIDLAKIANLIATVWASNAVVLAVMLGHKRSFRNYAAVLAEGCAATALASVLAGNSLSLCAVLLPANLVEIVTALLLLTIFRIDASNLTTFRGLFIFVVTAGGIAPIGSTLISAMAFGAEYQAPWLTIWRNWYPGHALGMIIVVPFLISVTSAEWQALRFKDRIPEALAVFVLFVGVGLGASYFRFFIFLLAPAILFATARFGIVGATATTFATAIITSTFVVLGIGHPLLSQPELSDRIFALQDFLAITAFWALPTAALLTERDRLLEDLSRANSRLMAESEKTSHLVTGLRRHLSIVEEKERLRLSHELHDQAGQSLIAAILELNEIDALIFGPARQRLHLVRKKMEDMGKTLHRIAWELRPPSIDELGLRKALASYIADWSEQCGTEVDFHCDDPELDEVPNEIGTALYRVVQEGLTNIVKHAQRPSDVSVVITHQDATLQLIIEDNGCGFDVGANGVKAGNHKSANYKAEKLTTGIHRGLGLDGMRERLSLIGGTLEVESTIGSGTTIFARITLDGQK